MNKFFVSIATLLLAGCGSTSEVGETTTPTFVATQVNYGATAEAAAAYAGVSLVGAPSIANFPSEGVGRGVATLALVGLDDPQAERFDAASLHELLHFAAQYPELIGNRSGVCARGSYALNEDGEPVYPVLSSVNGALFAGLWQNCYYQLVAARSPTNDMPPRKAMTSG